MSDELHYWHETDDPHRLERPLEVDANGEWKPDLWTPPPVWYRGGRAVYYGTYRQESAIVPGRWASADTVISEQAAQNIVKKMQAGAAQQFMRDMDSAMLYGNPYHSEDAFIRRWKPSRWYRFKLWVWQTINRVRDFFARDDDDGDYDE